MCHSAAEGVYPLRDMFPHFIAPAAEGLGGLRLASRCDPRCTQGAGLDPLPLSAELRFEPLPFYANTEDFYRRRLAIYGETKRRITHLVRTSGGVILRIHHAMAVEIARIARREGKPLMAYWAGATVSDTSRANYRGYHPKHVAARWIAAWKHRQHRRIAADADWNFFIDPVEFAQMGSPERTQWVIPNLVREDTIAEAPSARIGEELVVVFAGRIYRHKGVFELLDAVTRLVQAGRKVRLRYAGDGPHLAELRQAIESRRLGDFVEALGPLRRECLAAFFAESQVFVLASHSEGLPKTLWEAWARGLACVLSPVGAIPQHVTDGVNGLLVPAGNSEALAGALERLYLDESLRTRLAARGLESVRAHTWEREISAIVAGIRAVVDPARAHSSH
jgi:glycosyltransferase involved in cell wall biosynthesis